MSSSEVLEIASAARPELSPALSPGSRFRSRRTLSAVMAGLVVVFAFVVACFPADNSGLFLNLATGRAILAGQAPWGSDLFSYTATSGGWAPSWLFDVVLFEVYTWPEIGPASAIVLKAVLIGILAVFSIACGCRTGQSLAVSAACAALAILALSSRLALQPVVMSYLFLGVTLWILREGLEPGKQSNRVLWLLPPLCLLWANCDEHFLLGPIAVGLALLGEVLLPRSDATHDATRNTWKQLGFVVIACLVACLINPAHVHSLRLPWQLGLLSSSEGLAQDREFRMLFVSPLEGSYYQSGVGLNVAGLAWLPLALLGAASFAPRPGFRRPRGWRFSIWVGFLLLALMNYRSLAFFAVVAGPILALNILDRSKELSPRGPSWLPIGGTLLGVFAMTLLIALSLPGWLQGQSSRRQFGLAVLVDPSLRDAALRLEEWRRAGQLDSLGRIFPTTPDAACYLAWFAPEVKGFLDLRLHLFAKSQDDFVSARTALMEAPRDAGTEPGWRPVFRRWDVRQVLLHFRDARRSGAQVALAQMLASTFEAARGEWTLCHLDGRTAIATWNDPDKPRGLVAPPTLDLERMAFGPRVESVEVESAANAVPARHRWFSDPPRPIAADEATCYLTVYELLKPAQTRRQQNSFHFALAAGTVTAGSDARLPGPTSHLLLHLALSRAGKHIRGKVVEPALVRVRRHMGSNYQAIQDPGPVSALYLSLRAARRSLVERPRDAQTSFLLGQTVMELGGHTRESSLPLLMPQVLLIRQTQAAAALHDAITSDPDHEDAHALLAELAQSSVFLRGGKKVDPVTGPLRPIANLEMEAEHRQEQLRIVRKTGPRRGESEKDYLVRRSALEKEVNRLRQRVRSMLDEFELGADKKPPAVRAELALDKGLVERAMLELRRAREGGDSQTVRGSSARLVELLLATGRVEESAALLQLEGLELLRNFSTPFGLPAAEWFGVLVAASTGQYDLADRILERIQGDTHVQPDASNLLAQAVGHVLLWEAPLAAGMPGQFLRRSPALLGLPPTSMGILAVLLPDALAQLQARADLAALRGLLALEAGDMKIARHHFEKVMSLGRSESGTLLHLRAVPLSRLELERIGP